ncbi:pyrroline-5-carboxylate reductase [Afifella sp. IM 167]|uniref:pyrroline-5-carboxylate reductase n=1 Tax=Afifella sp. IM 167 TaxID=2033586 RepID=UPI001CCEF395|nr:pyrroline-5-carboxylate reductase [Afifella sp. IM 167]MBZ8134889.1 pyrroline-5-carboxylate reductase [Afifella sp. IM 167]
MSLAETGGLVLVGAGRMGGAMLDAWLDAGLPGEKVSVFDPGLPGERRAELQDRGVVFAEKATDLAEAPRVVVIAVKPQQMDTVLPALAGLAGSGTLFLSVAAGIRLERLGRGLGASAPIVRVMPNTPSQVGAGMAVAVGNASVTDEDRALVEEMMLATGEIAWAEDEGLMDAVTALSGSGPAYVFHLVEAMAAAGESAGLPPELAARLARQTVIGGGALLAASQLSASKLRENVTSPGGTTQAALEVLMGEGGMPDLLRRAVAAAKKRSEELG